MPVSRRSFIQVFQSGSVIVMALVDKALSFGPMPTTNSYKDLPPGFPERGFVERGNLEEITKWIKSLERYHYDVVEHDIYHRLTYPKGALIPKRVCFFQIDRPHRHLSNLSRTNLPHKDKFVPVSFLIEGISVAFEGNSDVARKFCGSGARGQLIIGQKCYWEGLLFPYLTSSSETMFLGGKEGRPIVPVKVMAGQDILFEVLREEPLKIEHWGIDIYVVLHGLLSRTVS